MEEKEEGRYITAGAAAAVGEQIGTEIIEEIERTGIAAGEYRNPSRRGSAEMGAAKVIAWLIAWGESMAGLSAGIYPDEFLNKNSFLTGGFADYAKNYWAKTGRSYPLTEVLNTMATGAAPAFAALEAKINGYLKEKKTEASMFEAADMTARIDKVKKDKEKMHEVRAAGKNLLGGLGE